MGRRLALAIVGVATACATAPVGPHDDADELESVPNLARAISDSSEQPCILYDRGDVWCSDGESQRHLDLQATQIVAARVDDYYDSDRDALTCALTSAGCRFWPEQIYEVDSYAPEFDLEAALAWTYYELRFDRSKRGVRLLAVTEVRGTDCTNC